MTPRVRRPACAVMAPAVLTVLMLAACTPSAPNVSPLPAPVSTAVDRTAPPPLGAPRTLTLPPVATRELANGLHIVIVEKHALPLADFVLVVRTGAEGDPAGRTGTATLTAAMLGEGTATRSSLAIADQRAYLGVQLQAGAGWDLSQLALHTPTAQLDSALALFGDVALHPTFPAQELERLRKDRLTTLVQLRDRAPQIADRVYNAIVYGPQHPYGRSTIGTEPTTRAITRADLETFYRSYYRPNNATLIVVGDVRPDDIERRALALFGGWERGTAVTPRVGDATPPAITTVYLVDKPGAPQSSVRIGGIGAPRTSDDYFALLVMNTILGGPFSSRLNQNLREKHGFTYGAFSRFDMRRAAGPFTARAEVTGTKTDSSLVQFLQELRAIRDTVGARELADSKRYLELQLPSQFETTGDIATQLVPVVLYGLPTDYYNTYARRIEEVTQQDVQRVARRYVDPAKVAIVIVGDRASVEPKVRALGIGDISVRDLSGELARP
ncbi:MAG: hypothetical protein NVS4B3_10560 [Gemmatimonadaceae bacterium]